MRGALVIVLVAGCDVGLGSTTLRLEPAALDVTVELDAATPVPFHLLQGDTDVTDQATVVVGGAPLGSVDRGRFLSDGRTGGRATISVTLDGETLVLPLRAVLHASRNETSVGAPGWFAAAISVPVDAALEPGDGALLPPNLAKLDIHFAPPAADDVHEVAFTGPELDVHVFGVGGDAELTSPEWDAISRTSRGQYVDLVERSLSVAAPGTAHVASAHLAIADLPLASEILFTGRHPADPVAQMWSYAPERASTMPWANGPGGTCLGCHLAISRDGRRIAAAGTSDPANGPAFGGGTIVDVPSRRIISPPSNAIGVWTAAAFAPDGSLVTANAGVLTLRDGGTALPFATLTIDGYANQPAVSRGGGALAYVEGAMDTTSNPNFPQPTPKEVRIHDWNPATRTLGPARILAPATDGQFVKLPDFSPDDRWVMYSRLTAASVVMGDIVVTLADGSAPPVTLASGYDMARFASPLVAARTGGPDTEPMMWIVMKSDRMIGTHSQAGRPQLYAMAFYPERGVASRPVLLPGQDAGIAVIHAPTVIDPR